MHMRPASFAILAVAAAALTLALVSLPSSRHFAARGLPGPDQVRENFVHSGCPLGAAKPEREPEIRRRLRRIPPGQAVIYLP
jgi:hypothetical protein